MPADREINWTDGLDILRLASRAPNGHNTQPWTITLVDPATWILGSDQTRRLPAVDPANREMLLSLGAFLGKSDHCRRT
jgi:hypothetical protein